MDLLNFDLYSWLILPLLIFFARIIDVTLGTLRIIFISRGRKYLAPLLLGFVEVFIWVAVISQLVRGANNLVAYLAYAAGFAAGNFIGMFIEDKLAIGTLIIRVIIQNHAEELVTNLHTAGFGVTSVDAKGASGAVNLIYTIVRRRDLAEVICIIHHDHPNAFVSIEEARSTREGIFPVRSSRTNGLPWRKGK